MKKVIVEIKSRQYGADGREEVIEMKSLANYYVKNGVSYVIYKQKDADMNEAVSTMLKISAGEVSLVRSGAIRHHQLFCEGVVSKSSYVTPYGTVQMKVKTDKLAVMPGSGMNLFEIVIGYDLYLNGERQSRNELNIAVYPAV